MNLSYEKSHACQNSYYFIDLMNENSLEAQLDLPRCAREICEAEPSGKADGLIALCSPKLGADARMRMFNRDGSEAEMCGNGIRSMAKLLFEKRGQRAKYRIETLAGMREAEIEDHSDEARFVVRVNMGRPSFLPSKIPVLFDDVMVLQESFEAMDREFLLSAVSMGNPHAVIEVENLESFDVDRYGSFIASHEAFPESCNVNFVEWQGQNLHIRTYERGSKETLSCGTGACASAVVMIMQKRAKNKVLIKSRGGDCLVAWDGLKEVWMTGEAVSEAKGQFQFSS